MIHSYPWYTRDWRASKAYRRMNHVQAGMFRELLDEYYQDGPLVNDEVELAAICRMSLADFRENWSVVSRWFAIRDDGRLGNQKADEIRERVAGWHDKKSESGRAGGIRSGEARRSKREAETKQYFDLLKANAKQNEANAKPSSTSTSTPASTSTTYAPPRAERAVEGGGVSPGDQAIIDACLSVAGTARARMSPPTAKIARQIRDALGDVPVSKYILLLAKKRQERPEIRSWGIFVTWAQEAQTMNIETHDAWERELYA